MFELLVEHSRLVPWMHAQRSVIERILHLRLLLLLDDTKILLIPLLYLVLDLLRHRILYAPALNFYLFFAWVDVALLRDTALLQVRVVWSIVFQLVEQSWLDFWQGLASRDLKLFTNSMLNEFLFLSIGINRFFRIFRDKTFKTRINDKVWWHFALEWPSSIASAKRGKGNLKSCSNPNLWEDAYSSFHLSDDLLADT